MKLVTAPVPRSLAKRRQTTKNACSTIGSAAARASSASLAPTASGRNAPQWARSTSATSGTASATAAFRSVPQAHATIPSSPTRQRIKARPSVLPSA